MLGFVRQMVLGLIVCCVVSVFFVSPVYSLTAEEKKLVLKKKLEDLKARKSKIAQDAQKRAQTASTGGKSLVDVIAQYEKLYSNCAAKTTDRCADVMYTLGKLYYDNARDLYIVARENYEKKMDKWEKNPIGDEPLNPIPSYKKSLDMYEIAIAKYPDFIKADEGYYQVGSVNMINGDLDKSKDAFLGLVNNFPNSVRSSAAHFRLAEFCYMDRDFASALKHLEKINLDQINPDVQQMAHYRKAEIYYNRANFEKAVALFSSFVEMCDGGEYPKKDLRDEALEYLAISFSDMDNGAESALSHFKKIGHRPYEAYIIYTVGQKNFTHGQYDQAISALSTALKSYPNHQEAPVAQQMIIACLVIRKKYDEANVQREKLVDYYNANGQWATQNASNPVAIEKAANEVKRALASIPIHYHAEAQKKKSKKMYEKALARYKQYIDLFPAEKWKVYEFKYNMAEIYNALRMYEKAAVNYDFVAQSDLSTFPAYRDDFDTLGMEQEEIEKLKTKKKKNNPVSISQEDAGYNAIAALDNLRKKKMVAGSLSDEQAYALPETKKFVEYITAFQLKFPQSSNASEVLYLAGNVHYTAKMNDAAISVFKKIITNYSNTKYAAKSLRMLANTYSNAGEFSMALEKYKELLTQEKSNTPEYQEVVDLAALAMYNKANFLKKNSDFVGAATIFKNISVQFASSKVADRGWFDAAIAYEEAKDFDLAAQTFKELGEKFSKSDLREKSYVRSAKVYENQKKWAEAATVFEIAAGKIAKADYAIPSLSSAAENYKKAKNYVKSGAMYEAILSRYPTDKRTPQSLYNAGLIYEKGKLYEKSIEMYSVLGSKYPENEYASEGFYSIGFCYEKMKQPIKMAQAFTAYAQKFTQNRSKQVVALVRAAEAYMKMEPQNTTEALKNVEMAILVYDKYKKKASIDPTAISKAFFTLGKIRHAEFDEIKLIGKTEKIVQDMVKKKTKSLEPVLKAYAEVISIGIGEYTIRSTYMIALSFVDLSEAVENQKLFGSKEQQVASRIRIISSLEKYYIKAMEKLHWNIETAYSQNLKNSWVMKSEHKFMELAYRKGFLFEKIGLIFKNAPLPRGMDKEDQMMYKDVLEEKYLEALDAALPKYEEAMKGAEVLGLIDNPWVDSVRARIEFINPSSVALLLKIVKRVPKVVASEAVVNADNKKSVVSNLSGDASQTLLRTALARIEHIMTLKLEQHEKIAQLVIIENDAKREIERIKDVIFDLKEKKAVN